MKILLGIYTHKYLDYLLATLKLLNTKRLNLYLIVIVCVLSYFRFVFVQNLLRILELFVDSNQDSSQRKFRLTYFIELKYFFVLSPTPFLKNKDS